MQGTDPPPSAATIVVVGLLAPRRGDGRRPLRLHAAAAADAGARRPEPRPGRRGSPPPTTSATRPARSPAACGRRRRTRPPLAASSRSRSRRWRWASTAGYAGLARAALRRRRGERLRARRRLRLGAGGARRARPRRLVGRRLLRRRRRHRARRRRRARRRHRRRSRRRRVWLRARRGRARRSRRSAGGRCGADAGAGRPAAVAPRRASACGDARLVAGYGAFGFGYILPATFLPAMAREAIADPAVFGWIWPAFGATAAASTALVALACRRDVAGAPVDREPRRHGRRRARAGGRPGLAGLLVAAVCVGGTFMVATMAGMQEARRRAGAAAPRLMAAMTAAFALGQLAGPWSSPSPRRRAPAASPGRASPAPRACSPPRSPCATTAQTLATPPRLRPRTAPMSTLADRMPPLPRERMTEAQRAAADELIAGPRKGVKGPFIPLLRSPELMARLQKVGEYLRFDSALPPRLSEFATLLVAAPVDAAVRVGRARAAGARRPAPRRRRSTRCARAAGRRR